MAELIVQQEAKLKEIIVLKSPLRCVHSKGLPAVAISYDLQEE